MYSNANRRQPKLLASLLLLYGERRPRQHVLAATSSSVTALLWPYEEVLDGEECKAWNDPKDKEAAVGEGKDSERNGRWNQRGQNRSRSGRWIASRRIRRRFSWTWHKGRRSERWRSVPRRNERSWRLQVSVHSRMYKSTKTLIIDVRRTFYSPLESPQMPVNSRWCEKPQQHRFHRKMLQYAEHIREKLCQLVLHQSRQLAHWSSHWVCSRTLSRKPEHSRRYEGDRLWTRFAIIRLELRWPGA